MKFLAQMYDFMFAPAGTFDFDFDFDSDSGSGNMSSDNNFVEHETTMVNPANGVLMIDGSGGIGGIDILGNPYGVDLHPHHEDFIADHSTMFSHDDCSYAVNHSTSFFEDSVMSDSAPMFESSPMFDCSSSSSWTGFDD